MTLLPALLADSAPLAWPDSVDGIGLLAFVGVAVGLPVAGYLFLALDIRRRLRSLRRALVVVARHVAPSTPSWAYRDRPPCLAALDLALPCSEADVLNAYRRRVKDLHPDHGGDLQQFLKLQKHFEQALHLVRQNATRGSRRAFS